MSCPTPFDATVYDGGQPMPREGTVIVVGGGLAGLCAAATAAEKAPHVILLDKEPKLGGNSAKATSGMNAAATAAQHAHGVKDDSPELMTMDTMTSGHGKSVPALVHTLTQLSRDAWAWLRDECDADLADVSMCGGHSRPRTHRFAPDESGKMRPVGFGLIQQLQKRLEAVAKKSGCKLQVMTGCRVVGLVVTPSTDLVHPGSVVGVKVCAVDAASSSSPSSSSSKPVEILGEAVIMTAGGYGNDHGEDSLLRKHAPHVAHLASTNGLQATGDAVRLGLAVGAKTVDLDQVQVHPTGLVDPANEGSHHKFLGPEALRGKGGILLNHLGERFCNELGRRDDVTASILSSCEERGGNRTAYLVMSPAAVEAYGSGAIGFYASKGFFTRCDGAAAVAEAIGATADRAVVEKTLAEYAAACEAGDPDRFGRADRRAPPTPADEGMMVARITPVTHYTMGGLLINSSAEVLYETNHGNHKPLPGLFAAGEATGGVHGGNRLGGNSLLECVVYGRIAGERAAAGVTLPRHVSPLSTDSFVALRLAEKEPVGGHIYKYSFELPSPYQHAGLAVGQYVNVRAVIGGEAIVRPYSPLTRPGDTGHIELMVKADPNGNGKMSSYLSSLQVGSTLEFAGPMGGIDLYQARVSKIGLIAGGVGIAPMLSIIRTVFRERSLHTMKLIYAAGTTDDMPYRDRLLEEAKQRSDFDVSLTLEKPPMGWEHDTGFVTPEMVKANMFPPQDDLIIIVCGPPAMCKALKGVLAGLGYTDKMVYSYM